MKSELDEIRAEFKKTLELYSQHLSKVDRALVEDLLRRQDGNQEAAQPYLLEVFTAQGTDSESFRQFLMERSGQSPAVYDNGTHFVIYAKVTLEDLDEISRHEGVEELTGDYTGDGMGTWASSHEHTRKLEHEEKPVSDVKQNSKPKIRQERVAVAAGATVAAIALAAALLGGVTSLSSTALGAEASMLFGTVTSLSNGISPQGAIVVATDQAGGQTYSATVSGDGHYSINLPAGTYALTVGYTDGTTKTLDSVTVASGVAQELNVSF